MTVSNIESYDIFVVNHFKELLVHRARTAEKIIREIQELTIWKEH